MNHSSSIYLVIHLRHVTEKISGILCYVICTKYRYLLLFMEHLRRGEEETLFQPTFYAVWIRVSRGFSNFCLRSRILCTLYTLHLSSSKFFEKIPRENGRRPIGNIENSTIVPVSAVFWILTRTTRSRRMDEGRKQRGGKEVDKEGNTIR